MLLRFRDIVPPGEHCHVHIRRIAAPLAQAVHDHDFCEVFWIDEGSGNHLVNGERRPLEKGRLVLIRPEDTHGFTIDEGRSLRLVNVAFARSTWSHIVGRYGLDDLLARPLGERELMLDADGARELALMARELFAGARSRMAIERFLLNLIHFIHASAGAATPPGVPEWLAAACAAVRDPRRCAKGPSALVRLSGRTPEHVAREAKRWLGKRPTDIVNDARAANAAARLAETDAPILAIALDCGIENISHFYRLFRARYGTTPGRYRRRHQRVLGPETST